MRRGPVRISRAAGACAIAAGVAVALMSGCGEDDASGGEIRAIVRFGEVGRSPGQFSYPRGIDAGGGSLWIVDKLARIQRMDPVSGKGLGEWKMPVQELGRPTGVTVFDPDAKVEGDEIVFVADTHYHRVMAYHARAATPGGGIVSDADVYASFGSFGEGDGQMVYPTDIAVEPTPDGKGIARVFVSEYGGNDRISEWAMHAPGAFTFVRAFGKFGDGAGKGLEFNRPQSIAIDAERGELIVSDACNHRLVRVRLSDATQAGVIGGPGTQAGKFKYPYGLVLLGDGTAMVAEFGNCRVQRVDLETGQSLGVWGKAGRGEGDLATPWGVAMVGEVVYVLDSGNNRVIGIERPRSRR